MISYHKWTPEAWHARVLRDEIDRLTVAVRELEFSQGYDLGRGVITDAMAMEDAKKSTGTPPGVTGQSA